MRLVTSSESDHYMGPPESEVSLWWFRRIRDLLAEDRDRGLPFSEAWGRAVAKAPNSIRPTLKWSRDAWQAAYVGAPPPARVRAIGNLSAFGAEDDRQPVRLGA